MHQLPAVGSCAAAGRRPAVHVRPVVDFCCVLHRDGSSGTNTGSICAAALEKKYFDSFQRTVADVMTVLSSCLSLTIRLLPVFMLYMELQIYNS